MQLFLRLCEHVSEIYFQDGARGEKSKSYGLAWRNTVVGENMRMSTDKENAKVDGDWLGGACHRIWASNPGHRHYRLAFSPNFQEKEDARTQIYMLHHHFIYSQTSRLEKQDL